MNQESIQAINRLDESIDKLTDQISELISAIKGFDLKSTDSKLDSLKVAVENLHEAMANR